MLKALLELREFERLSIYERVLEVCLALGFNISLASLLALFTISVLFRRRIVLLFV